MVVKNVTASISVLRVLQKHAGKTQQQFIVQAARAILNGPLNISLLHFGSTISMPISGKKFYH